MKEIIKKGKLERLTFKCWYCKEEWVSDEYLIHLDNSRQSEIYWGNATCSTCNKIVATRMWSLSGRSPY